MLNNVTSVTTGPIVRLADQVLSVQVWGSVSENTGSATVTYINAAIGGQKAEANNINTG